MKTLVIVEDEALIADMVQTMAEDAGWSVQGVAHSAQAAHELLAAHEPVVAILDINLGNCNSADVASACRQRGIQIIYITGYTSDHAPEGQFAALLTKPFTGEELAEALSQAEAQGVAGRS